MNELKETLTAVIERADNIVVIAGTKGAYQTSEIQQHADLIRDHASRVCLYLDRAEKEDVGPTWLRRYIELAKVSGRVVQDSINRIEELFPNPEFHAMDLLEQRPELNNLVSFQPTVTNA